MYDKEKDAIGAFLRGEMDRRALIRRLGGLGLTAASAGTLYNMMASDALAALLEMCGITIETLSARGVTGWSSRMTGWDIPASAMA